MIEFLHKRATLFGVSAVALPVVGQGSRTVVVGKT